MLNRLLRVGALLAPIAIAAGGAHAGTNIVQNPGFETGSLAPWVSNGAANHPWGIGPVETAVHSGSYNAQTGCVGPQCTDETNLATAAYLYQDLATTAGDTYSLSFYFGGAGANDELKVLFGSGVVLDLVNSDIVSNNGTVETLYTVNNLMATSSTTRLMFLGRQDPGYDGLDDVSVMAAGGGVPEPATWALMLIGVGAAGGALRRSRGGAVTA
jgi:hypothetical protein